MTEMEATSTEPTPGTAADYMRFLNWAGRTGELPKTTVMNWRIASTKVLEIEDNWQDVNVAEFDLEAFLRRFETLKRTAYSSASMKAYKSRARVGIEAYRGWLAKVPDWKPKVSGSAKPTNNAAKKLTGGPAQATGIEMAGKNEVTIGGYVPHHAALIEYPLPIRPGVRALLALPEDLTEKEAKRVARFVESLAFSEQPAITTGEVPAE